MNTFSVPHSPVIRSGQRANALVILCVAALFALDLSLYHVGRSWTPIHYESLAPLLALGGPSARLRGVSATAAALLFGTIAVLFFAFGLTWRLATESWVFLAGAIAAALVWLIAALVNAWRHRRPPITFLMLMLAMLGADKLLSYDMLSSFYTPHFFRMDASAHVSPSANPVHASLSARLGPSQGAVLIVFEALGVPQDRTVVERLQREFPDFVFTTPAFEGGSTVPAEVRYLCGVNGSITDYSGCLPHRLRSRAMHGNSLAYFSRNLIYREMGFQETLGRHELEGLRDCRYAYTAICDEALWDRLAQYVQRSGCRDFNYALSIDSHFPYAKYAKHVEGLYGDLRVLLLRMRRLQAAVPGCPIIIAGDHPPPLAGGFEGRQVMIVSSKR